MTIKQILAAMTKEEKQMVEHHAFGAALAIAHFWDALRIVETKYGVEFDGTVTALESLASECDAPATIADFESKSAEDIMEMFDIEDAAPSSPFKKDDEDDDTVTA